MIKLKLKNNDAVLDCLYFGQNIKIKLKDAKKILVGKFQQAGEGILELETEDDDYWYCEHIKISRIKEIEIC